MREAFVLLSDNATVVVYLEKQGGTVCPDMCRLAQEIISWSGPHMASTSARYILGKKNILTDQLSHLDQVLPTENGPSAVR